MNMRVRLSMMWLFAMLNYLYADVMSLMDPQGLKRVMTGQVGALHITPGFLLGAAVLMETAIAMVLFSRLLAHRVNRLANIGVGILHTAAVLMSLFTGNPALYYIFFAAMEIPCTILIVWFAWRWREETSSGFERKGLAASAGGSR